MPSRLVLIGALTFLMATQFGCVHVQLDSKAFLRPDRGPSAAHLHPSYAVENGVLRSGDRLIGFSRAHREGNRNVILFCGGDSFHRSLAGGAVLEALARDSDVVIFDYPGFGDSTGAPDVPSLLAAARAIHEQVAQSARLSGQRVVLYGFSLGAMLATQIATTGNVDALVLEAGVADVRSWAWSQVPWPIRPIVRLDIAPDLEQIDGVSALASFRGPVLVLAGKRDKRVPSRLSREMVRRLKHEGVNAFLSEFGGAGHGEIHSSPDFGVRLDHFLSSL